MALRRGEARSVETTLAKSMLLAGVFVAIGMTWLVIYAYVVGSVARSPRFRRVVEAISGAVSIALGARLAIDRG